MPKIPPIALMVVLATAVGSVLLPVAINIATGGAVPAWLEPHRSWAWPVVLVLGLVSIVLAVLQLLAASPESKIGRLIRPGFRDRASAHVRHHLDQRLDQEPIRAIRVQLDLDLVPDAVLPPPPADRVGPGAPLRVMENARPLDVYDRLDGSMLILGAPGAGKSTMILELAKALLDRADGPLPLVVELGEWGRRRRTLLRTRPPEDLREWLLRQIEKLYDVGANIADRWLEDGTVTLLLDGFDEVGPEFRARCLTEVNALYDRYPQLSMVIGSRAEEYDALPARQQFRLYGAVVIRPLTGERVLAYLASGGPELRSAHEAVERDPEMLELISAPLWLHVLAGAVTDADPGAGGWSRNDLLAAYVEQMFHLKRARRQHYGKDQMLRWISQLARVTLALNSRTLPGSLPGLRPFLWWWALPPATRSSVAGEGANIAVAMWSATLTAVLIVTGGGAGGIAGFVMSLALMASVRILLASKDPVVRVAAVRIKGWIYGAVIGVAGAAIIIGMAGLGGLVARSLTFSPVRAAALVFLALCVVAFLGSMRLRRRLEWPALLMGVVLAALAWPVEEKGTASFFVGVGVAFCAAFLTMTVYSPDLAMDPFDVQLSDRIAWFVMGAGVLPGVVIGVLWGAGDDLSLDAVLGMLVGVLAGVFLSVPVVFSVRGVGGWALLVLSGLLPLRYRRFVIQAAEIGLLRRDGKGYRFPHLILTEYLAREADRPPRRSSPA
ncbi:hypothetical protein [Herbidospora sp. NBRC 101105]|uniref:NACHT domain-containing protein n=1 Tax=Herbidospora sp. NBRC 101105 TaxID=3032195 RepID=UPI0024A31A8F|nr:hypothetical protein [Herbidospora sp. NBRC 101105]GLX97880.1 hypothetical protein Hesp01_58300 [Herbidospora sp. NBRC 101105]